VSEWDKDYGMLQRMNSVNVQGGPWTTKSNFKGSQHRKQKWIRGGTQKNVTKGITFTSTTTVEKILEAT
jgi:hypothetical protein